MTFTQRQKKLLVIGAISLVIASGYRFWPFLQEVFAPEDSILTEQRLVTLKKQIAKKKRLEEQSIIEDRQLNKLQIGLLRGTTPALAAVTIQNVLNELAEKNDVEIQSVRVLKADKSKDEELAMYTLISIQARMELSVSQMEKILYGLAKSSNLILVDSLDVKSLAKGATGTLMVTLTLKGLMMEG